MAKPRTKQQHFVPRFYLDYFADPDGKVWTYDIANNRVWTTSPEKTARQSNIYTPKDPEGGYFEDIENWLHTVESKAADLYPEVLDAKELRGQDRADFALFIASLYSRSPANIRLSAEMLGHMLQVPLQMYYEDRDRFDQMMDEVDAATGKVTSKAQRDSAFEQGRDPKKFTLSIAQRVGLIGVLVCDRIAPILNDMRWHVFEIPDQHLITGDSPFVQVTDPKKYDSTYGDAGFYSKSSVVTLPLSPSRILQLTWDIPAPEGRLYPEKKALGRLFNRQRAYFAADYLFASQHDAGISKLGQKHKASGRRFELSGEEDRSPVKVVRTLKDD